MLSDEEYEDWEEVKAPQPLPQPIERTEIVVATTSLCFIDTKENLVIEDRKGDFQFNENLVLFLKVNHINHIGLLCVEAFDMHLKASLRTYLKHHDISVEFYECITSALTLTVYDQILTKSYSRPVLLLGEFNENSSLSALKKIKFPASGIYFPANSERLSSSEFISLLNDEDFENTIIAEYSAIMLTIAVTNLDFCELQALLQLKPTPDIAPVFYKEKDPRAQERLAGQYPTLLHFALLNGRNSSKEYDTAKEETVKVLLRFGAKTNVRNKGASFLAGGVTAEDIAKKWITEVSRERNSVFSL